MLEVHHNIQLKLLKQLRVVCHLLTFTGMNPGVNLFRATISNDETLQLFYTFCGGKGLAEGRYNYD
jgi:hypothetical protein